VSEFPKIFYDYFFFANWKGISLEHILHAFNYQCYVQNLSTWHFMTFQIFYKETNDCERVPCKKFPSGILTISFWWFFLRYERISLYTSLEYETVDWLLSGLYRADGYFLKISFLRLCGWQFILPKSMQRFLGMCAKYIFSRSSNTLTVSQVFFRQVGNGTLQIINLYKGCFIS